MSNPFRGLHYSKCPKNGFFFAFDWSLRALICVVERCEGLPLPLPLDGTMGFEPSFLSGDFEFNRAGISLDQRWKRMEGEDEFEGSGFGRVGGANNG